MLLMKVLACSASSRVRCLKGLVIKSPIAVITLLLLRLRAKGEEQRLPSVLENLNSGQGEPALQVGVNCFIPRLMQTLQHSIVMPHIVVHYRG